MSEPSRFPKFESLLGMSSRDFHKKLDEVGESMTDERAKLMKVLTSVAVIETGKTALETLSFIPDAKAQTFLAMSVCLRTAVEMAALYPGEFEERLLDLLLGFEKEVQEKMDAAKRKG